MAASVFSDDILLPGIVYGNYAGTNHAWIRGSCLWSARMEMEKNLYGVFELSAEYGSGSGLSGASIMENGRRK